MIGVSSDAGLFPFFTLPTPTIPTMGDLQQPVQSQSGASTSDLGTTFLDIQRS